MGLTGMRKLAVDNLTDGEIVKFSLEILKDGPLIAAQIAKVILTRTGKSIRPHRIGHILAACTNRFSKDRPGRIRDHDNAWTYSLLNWVIPPNHGKRIKMSEVDIRVGWDAQDS